MKSYTVTQEVFDRLTNNFTYHKPTESQPERYEAIRDKALELGILLATYCPASRELSVALTNLEDAVMWANASIARNEKETGE